MKNLREYRIEFGAVLVVLAGIFLIFEQYNLRAALQQSRLSFIASIRNTGSRLLQWIEAYLAGFTLSDLVGMALLVFAGAFILWRIRYRYQNSTRWLAASCPRCGGSLHRIHRTALDRLIGRIFLPTSRRYGCPNPRCRWTGLRHAGQRSYRHRTEDDPVSPDIKGGML